VPRRQDNYARLTVHDVIELDAASQHLVEAYAALDRFKPKCGPTVQRFIFLANETIVRLQNKGARAIRDFYARHPEVKNPYASAETPENTAAAEPQPSTPENE